MMRGRSSGPGPPQGEWGATDLGQLGEWALEPQPARGLYDVYRARPRPPSAMPRDGGTGPPCVGRQSPDADDENMHFFQKTYVFNKKKQLLVRRNR